MPHLDTLPDQPADQPLQGEAVPGDAPGPVAAQADRQARPRSSSPAGRLVGTVSRHLLLIVVTAVALIPIYFMVVTSFKNRFAYADSQLGFPTDPSLANFSKVLGDPMFLTWIRNSILLTLVSVGIGVTVSAMAAYAFAWIDFPFKNTLFVIFVALLGAPAVAMIIPLFKAMVWAHLINTYQGAVIIYVGLMIPYTTYFLTAFFRRLPDSLFEAARLDGCGHFRLFWRIVLPLSKPGLITLLLVNTLWVWNELLIAVVFLQKTDRRTLMAGLIQFQGELSGDIPAVMAGLVIAVIPMLVLYLSSLRYFLSGFLMGSDK